MRKTYILIFEDSFASLDVVREHIDNIPEILNWRTELPNSFFLISELSAQQLYEKIKPLKETGKFLVAEISTNKQGWLGKSTWNLINKRFTPNEEVE